jgi:uncharacterized membrane protein YuzA (DUF378 family)
MVWQDIFSYVLVALAAVYVVRNFVNKYLKPEAECGGCGKCAAAEKTAKPNN